jgi:histidinol dehydrogenase
VPAELRQAMVDAAERIARFHAAGMGKGYAVETAPGVVCERMLRPIGRVACTCRPAARRCRPPR